MQHFTDKHSAVLFFCLLFILSSPAGVLKKKNHTFITIIVL